MTKKWDPTKKTKKWNPRMEFDPISVWDGSVLWKDYGSPRRYVVTRVDENPRDVAARDREKNEKRERDVAEKREREMRKKEKRL